MFSITTLAYVYHYIRRLCLQQCILPERVMLSFWSGANAKRRSVLMFTTVYPTWESHAVVLEWCKCQASVCPVLV